MVLPIARCNKLQVISKPTLGKNGSMRAGSGVGTRRLEQRTTLGKVPGWQPPKGENLGPVVRSHDENVMCLRERECNSLSAQD